MLKVDKLSHSFGDKLLYKDAAFELYRGEHMGLVGQNGCGKSTLFEILRGNLIPDNGEISWLKNLNIGHLDQFASLDLHLSVFDYLKSAFKDIFDANEKLNSLYEQLTSNYDQKIMNKISILQDFLLKNNFYQLESEILKVADRLGISLIGLDKFLKDLSGGQKTKIILAKLLLQKPDVLLLDEPTNFLDKNHIDWLSEYLATYPNSFIVISHDFDFLNKITNCILEIEFCTLKKYKGNFTHFLQQKNFNRDIYLKSYDAQQKKIKKLEDYISKNKARAATANMAKSRQKQLDKIIKLAPPKSLPTPSFKLISLPINSQKALTVENLQIGYSYPLLPNINFHIDHGQKTVITGFNGIGKSTLLKTLIGQIRALSGKFKFADNTKIGYFKQDLEFPQPQINALDFISEQFPELSQKEIRKYLAQCALDSKKIFQPIEKLSGGEQTKLKICKLILQKTNFLILDEPTNHLDEDCKKVLEIQLAQWTGNLILVSHQESFYKPWADKIIDIGLGK